MNINIFNKVIRILIYFNIKRNIKNLNIACYLKLKINIRNSFKLIAIHKT